MWGLLAAAVVVLLLLLYIPGYLLLRGLGRVRCEALALAPAFSIAGFTLLAVVYAQVGIASTWISLAVPLVLVGLIVFLVGRRAADWEEGVDRADIPSFAVYLAAGVAAVLLMYVAPLGAADALVCGNDYAHHLNIVRSFIESGNWSTLDVTAFPGGEGAYYPAANSVISALPVSCLGVSVPISLNATNIVMAGFMYPLGMWAFMSRLFDRHDVRLYAGALCCIMIIAFPWDFFRRSVLLYANELGLVLLPAFMVAFVDLFERRDRALAGSASAYVRVRGGVVSRAFVVVVVLVAIGLSHPSAFFSAMPFVIAYVAYAIARSQRLRASGRRVLALGVWLAICIVVWVAVTRVPFMRDVVDYSYEARFGLPEGILSVFMLWAPFVGMQCVLGVLLIVGLVASANDRLRRWVLIPYAIAAVLSLACLVLPPCTLKSLLSGFWYNHSPRLIATAAVFAVPIIALGMGMLLAAIGKATRGRGGQVGPVPCTWVQAAAALALVAVVGFVPLPIPGSVTMRDYGSMMANSNDPRSQTSFLTSEERAFLEKASQITAGGGVVVNLPHDGSGYAYGLYGMNTMDRSFYPLTDTDELLLAEYIDKIGANTRVRQAADAVGAEYVLRLDVPGTGEAAQAPAMCASVEIVAKYVASIAIWPPQSEDAVAAFMQRMRNDLDPNRLKSTIYGVRFEVEDWAGVFGIRDDSPHFEVLLAEGDMRLYRIIR